MKLGIMQPYFLPYIGYWQLIKAVDIFVIYDNIEYTKKGWINRNRFLQDGKDAYFSIPLKKDSDFLDVKDRYISESFDKNKSLNQIWSAYLKAPCFNIIYPLFKAIIENKNENLFEYIYASVNEICDYIDIDTTIIKSSDIRIDHKLKAADKVLSVCKTLGADVYINTMGGQELYRNEFFKENSIDLKFIKPGNIKYRQFDNEFVPWLSILDVLMFNDKDLVKTMLEEYALV
jgi:hypothetical protein